MIYFSFITIYTDIFSYGVFGEIMSSIGVRYLLYRGARCKAFFMTPYIANLLKILLFLNNLGFLFDDSYVLIKILLD